MRLSPVGPTIWWRVSKSFSPITNGFNYRVLSPLILTLVILSFSSFLYLRVIHLNDHLPWWMEDDRTPGWSHVILRCSNAVRPDKMRSAISGMNWSAISGLHRSRMQRSRRCSTSWSSRRLQRRKCRSTLWKRKKTFKINYFKWSQKMIMTQGLCDTFFLKIIIKLHQWFPTELPQRGVRGATKFGITAFLFMFYYIRCPQIVILTNNGCRQFLLKTWWVPRTKEGWKTLNYTN